MERRIFHGNLTPDELANGLIAQFNRGNLQAQQLGQGNQVVVQIATKPIPSSGGQTALSVILERIEDGVAVQIGSQSWLGVAASLGLTALSALRNPLNLLGRLDDLAQDIENIQLSDQVWQTIERFARLRGATFELSERLRRIVCPYCRTANPIGESNCIACGAPLGESQPVTCPQCGFVIKHEEPVCPNCGMKLN
jgi:DNA-directed RNA polymerase subunit RPC12/RpoP